jgi:acetylornithine deacetylase/succinyl-diaminopimelate desuccinylase-like protein
MRRRGRVRAVTLPILLAGGLRLAAGEGVSALSGDDRRLARDILQELVEIPTTESGAGSTPAAEAVARRLSAAGFAATDVRLLGPTERKKNLVARLRGTATGRKPLLLFGHLDVVEARREDWSPDIDPFKLVERDGYFYGRGTQDMKGGVALLVTTFVRWKKEGFVPSRDLVLALTADEEEYGDTNGVAWLLKNDREAIDAEYAVNADAGDFVSKDHRPYQVSLSAAEKKETIVRLETTNRGGHGSQPRPDNAIYELAEALRRIEKLEFPPRTNEVTRAELAGLAALGAAPVAADLKAAAGEAPDPGAVLRLSQDPYYNALLRTTCVATQLEAGHGPSALPQRARAVVNCRILPGEAAADVLRTLREAIANDRVRAEWQFFEPRDWPASPLRPDVVSALKTVVEGLWPGVVIVPGMETGATDARFLRGAGIPTYGVSGIFIEDGDLRAHGKDERIRVEDFYAGLAFFDRFGKALTAPR